MPMATRFSWSETFTEAARAVSWATGTPLGLAFASAAVAVWALAYPLFPSTETWLILLSAVTSVVAYLMVFVLQQTQTRDTAAIQLKLDELIRAVEGARNEAIQAERLTEAELHALARQHAADADAARRATPPATP